MIRLFLSSSQIELDKILLTTEEFHHISRVVRLKKEGKIGNCY